MEAENKLAYISIEVTHPDIDIQQLYFEQFTQLKTMFYNYLGEAWEWQLHYTCADGK